MNLQRTSPTLAHLQRNSLHWRTYMALSLPSLAHVYRTFSPFIGARISHFLFLHWRTYVYRTLSPFIGARISHSLSLYWRTYIALSLSSLAHVYRILSLFIGARISHSLSLHWRTYSALPITGSLTAQFSP